MADKLVKTRSLQVSLSLFSWIGPNALPVVDQMRLDLERQSAFWFSWVKYAGYAVAAACFMEAPEVFVTVKRWSLLKFRSLDREETVKEKTSWLIPLAAVGLMIVVIGIAVETYAEARVSDVDTLLRAHESDKITAAEDRAAAAILKSGTAEESAKGAGVAAGVAKKDAGAASLKAEKAKTTADISQGVADRARHSASGAIALAEEAKADVTIVQSNIAHVDAKYAPRHLSKIERDVLVNRLFVAKFKSKNVIILWAENASDGAQYADELVAAINDARTGWSAQPLLAKFPGAAQSAGVLILVRNPEHAPLWTGELRDAMLTAGIDSSLVVDFDHFLTTDSDVAVVVAKKN